MGALKICRANCRVFSSCVKYSRLERELAELYTERSDLEKHIRNVKMTAELKTELGELQKKIDDLESEMYHVGLAE